MSNVVRVTLPNPTGGFYDASTDTDLDHFSLYSDLDNVLIKRAFTGLGHVAVAGGSGYTVDTIAHNLGYIPFFTVYANFIDLTGDNEKLLNNQSNPFSVPSAIASADVNNLYIYNFQATTLPYAYDIFYDDMSQTGNPQIVESESVFKVARPGKSALSKNPNDYIMHSDLNTFKILKQTTLASHALSSGLNTIAHGANIDSDYRQFIFIKFPDGKTTILGSAASYSFDETKWAIASMDGTNIYIYASSAYTVDITYIIYGTGVAGDIPLSQNVLGIAKSGKDILTTTDPEETTFYSTLPTLKYYVSDTYNMGAVTNATTQTIAHNLGYVPFFICFVNDYTNFVANGYCIAPYYEGRSTSTNPTQDISAQVYADSTNLYLKALYQTNASGTSRTFNWYYKLFKNSLGL